MKEVVIRKATVDDAAAMLDYLNIVGGESDNLLFGEKGFAHVSIEKEAQIITSMNESDKNIMLLGMVDGEIASIASLQGFTRDRIAHRGSIAITVKKKYWNQGIGSQMMKELISFGRLAGMTVLELQVKEDNIQAIALYKKFGFKEIGVYERFFYINGTYFDALLMNLYL